MKPKTFSTRLGPFVRAAGLAAASLGLWGCESTSGMSGGATAEINAETKFSVAEYGVPASPRVTTARDVKKGGGREMVGKPYTVRGRRYVPREEPGYDKAGLASWYGPNFHGRLTANGEVFDQYHLSAAHPTFPLPSYARVTNKKNGRSVVVRVNDRGPFSHRRIIDVSSKTADLLDMKREGVAAVRVEYVGRAPVEGDDTSFLMASYRAPDGPAAPQDDYSGAGTMLAMNEAGRSATLPGVQAVSAGDAGGQWTDPRAPAAVPLPTPQANSYVAAAAPAAPQGAVGSAEPLPVGFRLPEIGPVLEDRPSISIPIALGMPKGFEDVGLAYRGDRVTERSADPFKAILVEE